MALFIVMAVSICIIIAGIFGIISPAGIEAFAARWQKKPGLWTIFFIRFTFGISLWVIAPLSRTPAVLQALAVVSVFTAFLLLPAGVTRFKDLLYWWPGKSPVFKRGWHAVVLVMGIFILWSVIH